MPYSDDALAEVALSRAEYEAIVDRLGREPVPLELGLFGALWSEHCGYKHTKALLRELPRTSERLLVEQGAENAGVVDIGGGYAVAFKIESHNHPSAVEPFQGAATGVGGIVRDIFAMGARPIALLNTLRFGDPRLDRTRHLLAGVVSGISSYGNCIGIPNVGGEIVFDASYDGNPLVNVMCVGIIHGGDVVSARAEAPGDLLVLVGAKTGRDGIHGASGLASRDLEEGSEMRAAVQVGNPFMEKVLIEACLEAIKQPGVVGMQDCGAAGITSAAIEMAERSEMGLRIDVSRVPVRESGMTPYEVMLSESQERMLLAVKPDQTAPLFRLFTEWDLSAAVIGTFTDDGDVVVADADAVQTTTPVRTLTDAPEYRFEAPKPAWLAELQAFDFGALAPPSQSMSEVLEAMIAAPHVASKRSVWRRYDHQVQNNTVAGPGGDAAVLRIQGTTLGLAMTADGNGRQVYLNPHAGAAIAVAEACRNISCAGATPVALTDGLNFGNPEKPDVQYQLREAVRGIRDAALALDVPVISGNASLYNESAGAAIHPTPIIGAVGTMDDVRAAVGAGFVAAGDRVLVLGTSDVWDDLSGAGGSEALHQVYRITAGDVAIDLALEARLQRLCRELIADGVVKSAHDCSVGGLAAAVVESCVIGSVGAAIGSSRPLSPRDWLWQLFGETQSRIVVSVDADDVEQVLSRADDADVPAVEAGVIDGEVIAFGSGSGNDATAPADSAAVSITLDRATALWECGFQQALTG